MPRISRIKDGKYIYHVMCRSISDLLLFKEDNDRDRYLELIKRYQSKHLFKVYAYCIMTTHVHIIIDANGADISKFMHGINQSYAQYFNKKYRRHGHLFQDRFKSKVVTSERYLLALSAYIHNNPRDTKKYKVTPERYNYSSFSTYLGLSKDKYSILDESYIMQIFNCNIKLARKRYIEFVYNCANKNIEDDLEFKEEKTEYRSERIILNRYFNHEDIINFISKYMKREKHDIYVKYSKKTSDMRALTVYLMRCFCDMRFKDICNVIGNITLGRACELCERGLILTMGERYNKILEGFVAS